MGRSVNENGVLLTGDVRLCGGNENRFDLKLEGVPCSVEHGLLMGNFGENASAKDDFAGEELISLNRLAAEGVVGAFFGFFGDLSGP